MDLGSGMDVEDARTADRPRTKGRQHRKSTQPSSPSCTPSPQKRRKTKSSSSYFALTAVDATNGTQPSPSPSPHKCRKVLSAYFTTDAKTKDKEGDSDVIADDGRNWEGMALKGIEKSDAVKKALPLPFDAPVSYIGLLQEKLKGNPWQVLVATVFLNRH
ncbi:hypothetical protein BC829DRAFT_264142 [Chytridium lagenaria]|nr:hypothetical protein BC829DRAFT_264142 [Chytridium lagenaria]